MSDSLSSLVVPFPGEASTVAPGWLPPASAAAVPAAPLLLCEAGGGARLPLAIPGYVPGPGPRPPDPLGPCLYPFPALAVWTADTPPNTCD